jgi:UDP-N-acetylmuramyl pentapeptide phosphotransferase/UDP-N-acetylglucosamine-1-phosphate transferase
MIDFRIGYVAWFALFAAIGYAGAWLARRYALQRRLLDEPGERRSHTFATPRGGGIAIVAAFSIATLALIARAPSQIVSLTAGLIGFCMVAGIGWYDDHRPLSPWWRLGVHIVASIVLAAGLWLGGADEQVVLVAGLACLVLVNVWNFMDGIDGIAATQAALVAAVFGYCANSPVAALLALALIAAVCGFLPLNFPKARLFLGDVGSGALGFAIAWLGALAMDGTPRALWPLLSLPVSAFLLDAGLTLAARVLRGERWWLPHVEHVYQRWARRTGSHPAVTVFFAFWTVVAVIIAGRGLVANREGGAGSIVFVVLAWWCLGGALWFGLRSRSNDRPSKAVATPGKTDKGVDA